MRFSCPLHPDDHDRSCCPDLGIQTPQRGKGRKDLWAYTHRFGQKDAVQIRSKRHFERECGKRGLVHVTRDDLLRNKQGYHAEPKPVDAKLIEKTKAEIAPRLDSLIKQGAFKKD